MQGCIGLVSVRGLQFGEQDVCEITSKQFAKVDCVAEKGRFEA
jgi:hypothetical protein